MAEVRHTYEDRCGEVIDRPGLDLVELRWHDATAGMSAGQFQDWLAAFAGQHHRIVMTANLVRFSPPTALGGYRAWGCQVTRKSPSIRDK